MTRILMRQSKMRKVLSLMVTLAFVLSLTNVGIAAEGDSSGDDVQVQEVVQEEVDDSQEQADENDGPRGSRPVEQPSEEAAGVTADVTEGDSEGDKPNGDKPKVKDEPSEDKVSSSEAHDDGDSNEGQDKKDLPYDPAVVDGNPKLQEGGIRISSPGTFTHMVDGVEVTIEVCFYMTERGMEFSFSSSEPVVKVVAKGGPNARVTEYGGAMSDSGLHAPMVPSMKWAGISHIDFYFNVQDEGDLPADIHVYKFNDLDGDTVQDEGEEFLNGWIIRLKQGDAVIDSGVTSDGHVMFGNVAPGEYTIDEVLTEGWQNTTTLPMAISVQSDTDANYCIGNRAIPVEDVTKTFTLSYRNPPADAMFHAVYRLTGGEDVHVPLEPMGDGMFSASVELPAGSVIEMVRWAADMPGGVIYVLDEQQMREVINDDLTNSFAYTSEICGYKFGDVDYDGVWDENESGLSGWTIALYMVGSDTPVATTVTDTDGSYGFDGLLPGEYYVAEQMQDGWYQTCGPQGTFMVSDGTSIPDLVFGNGLSEVAPELFTKTFQLNYQQAPWDAQFVAYYRVQGGEMVAVPLLPNGSGVFTGSVQLPEGAVITDVAWVAEAGGAEYVLGEELGISETITADLTNEFTYTSAIAGFKFGDVDADGVWDESEGGLAGWTIHLFRAGSDTPIASAVTEADGSYSFEGLLPDGYTVHEVMQEGWMQTAGPEGTIPITNGMLVVNANFGNTAVLPEMVTKTFSLTYVGAPEGTTMSAWYRLVGGELVEVPLVAMGAGVYEASVELESGSVIDDVVWTASLGGQAYTLGEELDIDEALTADAVNAFTYTASLAGSKFGDTDADGVWDEGELGLAGWTINLFQEGVEGPVATAVTDAAGDYSFTGLLPDNYSMTETMQDGWVQTVAPLGAVAVVDGTAMADLDFGNNQPALPFTDFTFSKDADRTEANPGDLVTYALTYTLTADSDPWTAAIPIADNYDERYMTPVDVDGGVVADGQITWTDEVDMQPGESRSIVYTMRVIDDMPVGTTIVDNFAVLNVLQGFVDDWSVQVTVPEGFLPFTEDEPSGDPFLPFTGSELGLLAAAALMASAGGGLLRWLGRQHS